MTWTSFHRRGEVLRDVIAAADQRRDGILPLDIDGVSATFADDLDLLGALQLRWHTRLAGRIEREQMHQPMDLAGRRGAGLAAHRRGAARHPGDPRRAPRPTPVDEATAEVMSKSAAKEHMLLAVMAGLASAQDERAAAVGARIEDDARTSMAPYRRRRRLRPAPRRAPDLGGSAEGGPGRLTPDQATPDPAQLSLPPRAGARGRLSSGVLSHDVVMVDPTPEVRAGMLLVATPQLLDPNFADTVVLMLDVDDNGALGVVLNRPSGVPVAEVLETWGEIASEPEVLFRGGPVSTEGALGVGLCATATTCRSASARWTGRSAWSTSTRPVELVTGTLAGMRIFAGYAGWGAEQLAAEIEEGSWYVVPGEARDVFRDDPAELWRDVLRRQPGELAWHSTRPVDPELN